MMFTAKSLDLISHNQVSIQSWHKKERKMIPDYPDKKKRKKKYDVKWMQDLSWISCTLSLIHDNRKRISTNKNALVLADNNLQ